MEVLDAMAMNLMKLSELDTECGLSPPDSS